MPNRIIREDLLDSAHYWAATVDERQLYLHLMLSADDFGLVTLAPVFVRRRCFGEDPPTQETIDVMLAHLETVDLIRTYENAGARYAFIPRFRQTLRIEKAKHPMPPESLFADDEHAKQKFSKNKEKFPKTQSIGGASVAQTSSTRMPEVKGSEVKGIEEKGSEEKREEGKARPAAPVANCIPVESPEVKTGSEGEIEAQGNGALVGPAQPRDAYLDEWASRHKILQDHGETRAAFLTRVAVHRLKRGNGQTTERRLAA